MVFESQVKREHFSKWLHNHRGSTRNHTHTHWMAFLWLLCNKPNLTYASVVQFLIGNKWPAENCCKWWMRVMNSWEKKQIHCTEIIERNETAEGRDEWGLLFWSWNRIWQNFHMWQWSSDSHADEHLCYWCQKKISLLYISLLVLAVLLSCFLALLMYTKYECHCSRYSKL